MLGALGFVCGLLVAGASVAETDYLAINGRMLTLCRSRSCSAAGARHGNTSRGARQYRLDDDYPRREDYF